MSRMNCALAYISRTRHARSPQRVARTPDRSHSRLHFAHSTRTISAEGCAGMWQIALSPAFRVLSTRTISAEGCARTGQIALSPAFRAQDTHDLRRGLRGHVQIALSPPFRVLLDTHDLRRGLRGHRSNRTLACISRTRRARSPQRVARAWDKSHSRLHFAHSTRTISAEGCTVISQIALSPAFRALDTRDLRRGLRGHGTNRALACISRTRHARSPQKVARAQAKSHSRLHFAHTTRTISAEGCAGTDPIALSPAFRALDAHDLRRGLRAHRLHKSHSRLHFAHSTRTISAEGCARTGQIALSPAFRAHDTHELRRWLRGNRSNRTLACISRTRHARCPQRVARAQTQSRSRLHFAHSTRTISAEGCAHTGQIALSPAFRALDTHDLRRGLRGHTGQIALSPAFRALDTHDLRREVAFSVAAVRPTLRL